MKRNPLAHEESLRAVILGTPDLIWMWGSGGTFECINHQAELLTGWDLNQYNAGGWDAIIRPDDHATVLAAFANRKSKTECYEIEFRIRQATTGE